MGREKYNSSALLAIFVSKHLSKTMTLSKDIQHIDSRSVIPHKIFTSAVSESGWTCSLLWKHAFLFLMAFHYKVISTLTILLGNMLCDTKLYMDPL